MTQLSITFLRKDQRSLKDTYQAFKSPNTATKNHARQKKPVDIMRSTSSYLHPHVNNPDTLSKIRANQDLPTRRINTNPHHPESTKEPCFRDRHPNPSPGPVLPRTLPKPSFFRSPNISSLPSAHRIS